jgi:hypothetical protein
MPKIKSARMVKRSRVACLRRQLADAMDTYKRSVKWTRESYDWGTLAHSSAAQCERRALHKVQRLERALHKRVLTCGEYFSY